MKTIQDIPIGKIMEIFALLSEADVVETRTPAGVKNCGLVVAQFIGRLVFVAKMRIQDGTCHLTEVRNIRYWAVRNDGLGNLPAGPLDGDKIDQWPDTNIPYDKLISYMPADPEPWK